MTTQTKSIIIAAVVILALALWALIYFTPPAAAPGPDSIPADGSPATTSAPVIPTTTGSTTPAPGLSDITMVQVAAHDSAGDCWTVIRGSVYNLTSWISQHPGGQQAILQLCGKDGTAQFEGQHGGSALQEDKLVTFKIGVLGQ